MCHKRGYCMNCKCTKNITEKYNEFIDFSLSVSDSIAFHIVHYDVLSPEMLKMREDYQKSHPEKPSDDIAVNYEYYEKMDRVIKPIEEAIISKENAFSYLGYGYGHLCETFIVNAKHPSVREFLLTSDSIFNWKNPDFPEDVSFFRQGKCWIRNVAHENMMFFENITDYEFELLCKMGVELCLDE